MPAAAEEVGDGCDGLRDLEKRAATGRKDGRTASEIRALQIELDFLERADGSARLSCGSTVVLAAVYGPMECPLKQQQYDRTVLSVSVKGSSSDVSNSTKWIERFVRETLEPSILMKLQPRTAISLVLHVLEEDGAVISTAVNAATMALVDAGVPMRSTVCAASLAINTAGVTVLDPTQLEQSQALVYASFAFDSVEEGLVSAKVIGLFPDETSYFASMSTVQQATKKIRTFIQAAAENKVKKPQNF